MTEPSSPPAVRALLGRITRLEWLVAGLVAAVMVVLVVIEPDILEAPVENTRTVVFTVGGTALAAIALIAMLRFRVPAVARVVVLLVPFVAVNWWLVSPFFIDDVVEDEFATSISDARGRDTTTSSIAAAPTTPGSDVGTSAPTTTAPDAPVLLGSGSFRGLAGHEGTGDAGIFQQADGSLVLRLESFDIENGPDLRLYVVPGADQTSLASGSINLGRLRGNVGNQTYELPAGTDLEPGDWTVLVWCEAFSVEFVGATLPIA